MMDKTVPVGAALLLDLIGSIEAPQGYNTIYGNNQNKLPKPLTAMTVDQVIAAGPSWTKAYRSSAAGRYQFMNATLKDLKRELGLGGAQVLDANLQDRLGYHLLKRRGYDAFMAGRIGAIEFGKRLAQEWASFPVLSPTKGSTREVKRGQSYYAGDGLNKALISADRVEAMLLHLKMLASLPAQPDPNNDPIAQPELIVIDRPVVADPEELGTPPAKSKTVWTWALAVLGSVASSVGSVFGGLDWRVQIVITLITAGFAVYAAKRRNDLFKAVKKLHEEFG